ncbi:ammonium transporter 1 [Prunus dulcis]|uniref:Ammonium transporter 1 n=1 Tax=Prunus dulcis TaxID=3755 RepID=A0A4Y1RK82_PRUDU|nr:ammonium transporter 1 [Prunus dulcis]
MMPAMGKSFKDSLKALEADIQHANTVMSMLRYRAKRGEGDEKAERKIILKVEITYPDGKTTMSVYERKASIREFYGVIFPSLLQLQRGITDLEDRKQKEVCTVRYKRKEELDKGKLSEIDIEREKECGICMEAWAV